MENEKETTSAEPISQTNVAIIAVVMLAIGFGAGYVLFSGETEEGATDNTPVTGEEFVFDEERVNGITATFQDYFYVYSEGQPVELVYDSYYEDTNHVNLLYILNGQPFEIAVSKDYQYLYPSIMKYDDFQQQVTSAKAQMEAAPPVAEPAELQKTETPEVLLFVMSFCAYGNVAEDAMGPVVDVLGDNMEFEPIYIVSGGAGSWSALHGEQELNQNVREKIIYNLYGLETWMDYVETVNGLCDYTNADACWKAPAEEMNINTTEVEELFNNQTYFDELLLREMMFTSQYGVSGSPTLIVNGITMNVARTPESYKSTICDAYIEAPEDCNATLSEEAQGPDGSC